MDMGNISFQYSTGVLDGHSVAFMDTEAIRGQGAESGFEHCWQVGVARFDIQDGKMLLRDAVEHVLPVAKIDLPER